MTERTPPSTAIIVGHHSTVRWSCGSCGSHGDGLFFEAEKLQKELDIARAYIFDLEGAVLEAADDEGVDYLKQFVEAKAQGFRENDWDGWGYLDTMVGRYIKSGGCPR